VCGIELVLEKVRDKSKNESGRKRLRGAEEDINIHI